jgi:1,4-dihydroxy-2-naphthoate octaprenyltransferase
MDSYAEKGGNQEISAFRKINLIFRFSYTIPFFLASVCGVLYAWNYDAPLYVSVMIPVAVLFMAMFVNFTNDYFDHRSGVDEMVSEQRYEKAKKEMLADDAMLNKIYWDGNQFDTGLVTDRQGRIIIAALLAAILALAIPIVIYGGWAAVAFGIIGLFLAYFYTAPPVNLGARGLGEIAVGISFFMMTFCSFYVLTGTVDVPIIVYSAMIGIVVGLMRVVDSMSAQDAHIAFHERSISVRLGLDGTIPVVKSLIVVAYMLVAVLAYFNLLYLLLFLTIPLTAKAWKAMNEKKGHWELKVIPYFFGFSLFSEVLFILAVMLTMLVGTVVFW